MSKLIATKRVDLLAPYLALDQGSRVQAECECREYFGSKGGEGLCVMEGGEEKHKTRGKIMIRH